MNAKRSLFTSRFLLLLLGAAVCAQLHAQDVWREGVNLGGIQPQKKADAHLFGKFTSGDFRKPSEGSQLWTAGACAEAESYTRKGLVLSGNFGFEMVYGAQMMGSMFTNPGYYPVDVLEFTPGAKTRQTYDIGGGLAWKNNLQWTPSVTARFRGVNYAKRKDLRHTTYRQEAALTPSVVYTGSGFSIGLSYLLEKTSEFIQAEQIGSATADTYYAFLDKGLRYGAYQAWNGSGIHLAEAGIDRFAVKELSNGLALQAQVGPVYGDVSFSITRGEVGEKGYTWFRFPGAAIEAKLLWLWQSGAGDHEFRADYSWEKQDMREYIIERESVGGVTTPRIYGSNQILALRYMTIGPSWKFTSKDEWVLGAGLLFDINNDRSTLMYPFLDTDGGAHMRLKLETEIPFGNFLFQAGLLCRNKVGERRHIIDNDDESLGVSTRPFRLEEWWNKEQEVADAPQLTASLALRYQFQGRVPLYLEAGGSFLKAFQVKLLPGTYRQTSYIMLGYQF